MTEREVQELRELHWRGALPAEAQARLRRYLAQHPEHAADWETEATLNRALARLPDVPLASNFTAQVLAAVDREAVRAAGDRGLWGGLRQWLGRLAPRLAWAAAVAGVAWGLWAHHHLTERTRLVEGLGPVLQAAVLPDPQVLADFDAIQQLSQLPPPTDAELLSALSE